MRWSMPDFVFYTTYGTRWSQAIQMKINRITIIKSPYNFFGVLYPQIPGAGKKTCLIVSTMYTGHRDYGKLQ
jgi:hypothetical protein